MIRKSFVILFVVFNIYNVLSQKWIDKKYEYDSLLNLSYGEALNFNGDLKALHLDVYFPNCENGKIPSESPLLMWVHGGSFLAGSKEDVSIQQMCKEFAKRGYVTASIDYRLGFVSDDRNWQCNYPNYKCVFATDSAEWARAYYRAVQDGKGALRYLVNRYQEFGIDTNNIFLAGESAGAFTALGIGLLDTIIERPSQTYAISNVPIPNSNSLDCLYNQGISFNSDSIVRPDLGGINGTIEPSSINYTIKGIGNMYGAMLTDLLKNIPEGKPKPAIYSFHRPCDIIVSIDSNYVDWGLSWCFTNGYNCQGISNNEIMLYGSRVFSDWNKNNSYGYNIHDEFTSVEFPYSFIFGDGSCLDQVNNPCHAYDNRILRENNLALFFSTLITTSENCDTISTYAVFENNSDEINIFPNPSSNQVSISGSGFNNIRNVCIYNSVMNKIYSKDLVYDNELSIDISNYPIGVYIIYFINSDGSTSSSRLIKM